MSVTIFKNSHDNLQINRTYWVQKVIGSCIMAISILIFIGFKIFEPQRMGKTVGAIIFTKIVLCFLLLVLIRIFYFLAIDKNNILVKEGEWVKINSRIFLIAEIDSIRIVEYPGFRSMDNGFNVYLKLRNKKTIPISIRVTKEDAENVKDALVEFLQVETLEKKWRFIA